MSPEGARLVPVRRRNADAGPRVWVVWFEAMGKGEVDDCAGMIVLTAHLGHVPTTQPLHFSDEGFYASPD